MIYKNKEGFVMGIMDFFQKKTYDFDTIEGIEKISIPKYRLLSGIESPVNNIEYILQRKATEHKKSGRMDLAIACLKKSNEIMPFSNFTYSEKDYMRYIKYLRSDGQNDLADIEEKKLHQFHPELFDKRLGNQKRIKEAIAKCQKYNTDLLYITTNSHCPICSKYNKKVFSISGKTKRYPKLPEKFVSSGGFDESCVIGVSLKTSD